MLKRLGETPASARQKAQADDRAALKSFYEAPRARLVWVSPSGFTDRGQLAIAELKRADDWGLKASDYEIPTLAAGSREPGALADAEIGLGLAVLAYARHARGGRIDPTSISNLIDRKPRVYDPKTVMQAIAAAPAADAYMQFLYRDEAQDIIARHHYRPSDANAMERNKDRFPSIVLFPITEIAADWDAANERFFTEGGVFDQIFARDRN